MEDNSNLIVRYLEGTCSPEERIEVEKLKREDKTFAEELKWYQLAYASIELGAKERRRAELKELASADSPSQEAKVVSMTSKRSYMMYAIAAAIVLLFMVYVFVDPNGQSGDISSQDLWAISGPIEVNANVRGDLIADSAGLVLQLDSMIIHATELHQTGSCEEAEALWEGIAELSNIDEYRLSTVICYLNAKESSDALEYLSKVETIQQQKGENAESIDDQISWYKIIAYLQQYEKGENVEKNLKDALLHYQEEGYFQHQDRVKNILDKL